VDHRRSTLLAVAAAVLLGLQLLLLDRAGATDPLTGVATSRLVSVAVFLAVVLATRARLTGAARGDLVAVGLLDTGANLAFATATGYGLLSLVAVLSSLYPVVTAGLARVRLAERLSRSQGAGACLALGGVLLVVSG
jgi:drug/metabolite transporter (DMT)-like permease